MRRLIEGIGQNNRRLIQANYVYHGQLDPVIINLDDSYSYNEEPVEEPVDYIEIECEEESLTI